MEAFAPTERGALDYCRRLAGLLDMRAWQQLLALPRPCLYRRQHARTVDPGLREVVCAHRRAFAESSTKAGASRRRRDRRRGFGWHSTWTTNREAPTYRLDETQTQRLRAHLTRAARPTLASHAEASMRIHGSIGKR